MAVIALPKKGRTSSGATRAKEPKPLPSATTDSQAEPEKNWADKPDSAAYIKAAKLYETIVKGYENKDEQVNAISEYWNVYNATPDDNQFYNGNAQGYVPVVRDCINARAKRTLKQLFPANHKHVEGLASDNRTPYTQLAILEHYIRKTKLRSLVRTDLIAGDVTGQWNLMIDWTSTTRHVKKLVRKNPLIEKLGNEDAEDLGLEDPTAEEESLEEETVVNEGPDITDFATEDLVVIPPTCNDLQKAKAVSLRLRMSPEAVREMVDEGVFILPKGTEIEAFCKPDKAMDRKPRTKKQTADAGVRTDGTDKHAVIFMVYTKLNLGGEFNESAIVYYAGQDQIIGIIRNPLWSGKVPILSKPVDRLEGSFFGKSKIEPVKSLQWLATDFLNMGQDSAMYSLLPIWAVNPMQAPQWQALVMGLAAVWPVAPDDVKPLTQPQLWKEAQQNVDILKRQIWESMDVTDMMMGKTPPGRKNAQLIGGLQQEAQVPIADHATRYEEEMLNELLEFLFEFDQQYRVDDLVIEQRGEIGVKAKVTTIPPQQWGERFFFRWSGTEYLAGLQRMQQQIGTMNVLKGIPPQMLNGRKLDITPIIEGIVENVFGPEKAPLILIDERNKFKIEPDIENEILHNGMAVDVHEADDDQKHLQAHMQAAAFGDPLGLFAQHIAAHQQQLKRKREMQMMEQNPKGLIGSPGGGAGAAPPQGAAGSPRPGALPAPGRPVQQPPGAINADQMADPMAGVRG